MISRRFSSKYAEVWMECVGTILVKRKKRLGKKEKETTPAETKIFHRQLTRSENSQTQIRELKRTTLSKQSPKTIPLSTIITS